MQISYHSGSQNSCNASGVKILFFSLYIELSYFKMWKSIYNNYTYIYTGV